MWEETSIWAAIYLLGLVFAAGGIYATFRRMKKDLNGMGQKLNREIAGRQRDRLLILKIAPEGTRDELITEFLRET